MFRSVVGHLLKPSRCTLDNLIFRLHYRVTVGLLLVCAVALLWKINYGNPTNCSGRDIPSDMANDHCWYYGTYTFPEAKSKSVGTDIPYPGLDLDRGGAREYHNIHRWVVVYVLVQAFFFYLPRILWKSVEGRRVEALTWDSEDSMLKDSLRKIRIKQAVDYLTMPTFKNMVYLGGHVTCELLNLINVVVQLCLVSYLLQMPFPTTGILTLPRSQRNDNSAMSSFPLYVACTMHRFGPSGDVQRLSILCLMSISGFMEMIFICQWIWFALLSILSVMALIYRIGSLLIPDIRTLRLEDKAKLTSHSTVQRVTRNLGIGQWFLLYMMSKNVDPVNMKDILDAIAEEMSGKTALYVPLQPTGPPPTANNE